MVNNMGNGEELSSLKRIAILRALGGLGDFLCIVPALRSLRSSMPWAEIVLIGLPQTKDLINRFGHYLDDVLEFPGYPGLPEQVPQIQHIPEFFSKVQSQHFDLAIQMHGSGLLTNSLTVLLGARLNAGFFPPGQYCPDPVHFLPYLSHESEVKRYLRLLEYLGIPIQGEELEFPLHESDMHALSAIKEKYELHPGEYVCIHPGASVADRRWQPEGFAVVADHLAKQGLRVVLTGSKRELLLTQATANAMQFESFNLAGCTDLGAMAALLKNARLLVCNDTGVSHLADALQVPSVVIFTGSDVNRWAPLNRALHRIVWNEIGATPTDVIDQVEALLRQPNSFKSRMTSMHLAEAG
ncbi:glycosyltransferase family 9 protein [Kovacikia minuta CCNUW1]|uniref:glycosyltransferase family 9 protein n=1 Tax=Kovacikia minuta TaxID=2931930 RepID=UPI001CCE2A77|nr:glycosyltransferase family 9 protein [Kovacikia minuta]UBF26530.1 glycosyltransferase family 9 protein [Kovacikia minuta CCNUW1]